MQFLELFDLLIQIGFLLTTLLILVSSGLLESLLGSLVITSPTLVESRASWSVVVVIVVVVVIG